MDKDGEDHRQPDPEAAHEQGLLKGNDLALAIRDRQVEKEQEKNNRVKDDPEAYGHEFSARPTISSVSALRVFMQPIISGRKKPGHPSERARVSH